MTTTTNREMYRGDDYAELLRFKDGSQNAIDITNYLIYFTVKKTENTNDAQALKKVIYGIGHNPHTNPTHGETIVLLSKDDTKDFPVGSFYYDIQIKNPSGFIKTLTSGTFKVKVDITQEN